ncbi:flippase [Paraburkholderia lacunae]|nr:flippase [Paraburkholderia lacunae]
MISCNPQSTLDPTDSAAPGSNYVVNIVWNLLGTGLPLGVAFFAIPKLVAGFGNERFGLLTLIWAMIGYFSIFDLGLGRALTKLVADRLSTRNTVDLPDLLVTALLLIVTLAVIGGAGVALGAPWVLTSLLKINIELQGEGRGAALFLALSLPFVVISSALISLLEAFQQFRAINQIRFFLGIANFALPWIILNWSKNLVVVTLVLAAARLISTVLYAKACHSCGALGNRKGVFKKSLLRPLFDFGVWIAISNFISPIMQQLDRFVIGAVLSVAVVAFYTVPAEIIGRMGIFPNAFVSVLFPVFAAAWATNSPVRPKLFSNSCRTMNVGLLLPVVIVVLFAPEGLSIWLGSNFAIRGASSLRWLVLGFYINGVARVPFALLQSTGKPEIAAKLHLVELPLYAISLWWCLKNYGLEGAAIASLGRMIFDFIAMFALVGWQIPEVRRNSIEQAGFLVLTAAGVAAGILLTGRLGKLIVVIGVMFFVATFFQCYRLKNRVPEDLQLTPPEQMLS